MDPLACWQRFLEACQEGDWEGAAEAHADLVEWRRKGGFRPAEIPESAWKPGAPSFILGWHFGKREQRELTARDLAFEFPSADPDEFAQGVVDGIREDRFRLDLTLKGD
jgi:hypothetical protein